MEPQMPAGDPAARNFLASLEKVVMDLNDMENMIHDFDPGTMADPFFNKV